MLPAVFVGPSLGVTRASEVLAADYFGPAAQGYVYSAFVAGYREIAIIDGYFDSVPAVWHKEILFCISNGARVVGSSSMGALRAAELSGFGMEGHGRIFERYLSGEIQDDDEVAVLHAPPELGWQSLVIPMINIRFTLEQERCRSEFEDAEIDCIAMVSKSIFYRIRTWETLANELVRRRVIGLPTPDPPDRKLPFRFTNNSLLASRRTWGNRSRPATSNV